MTCAFCSGSGIQGMDAYGTRVPCRHCVKVDYNLVQEAFSDTPAPTYATVDEARSQEIEDLKTCVTLHAIEAELKRRGEPTTAVVSPTVDIVPDPPASSVETIKEAWHKALASVYAPDALISTITLKPGDHVVMHSDHGLRSDEIERIVWQVRAFFDRPDMKVMVLHDGVRMSVVSPESE